MYTPPGLAFAWVLAVDLAALGLGLWLLRRARLDAPDETRGERLGLALVAGLSALAFVVFALCALGVLHRPLVAGLVGALALLGLRELRRAPGDADGPSPWRDPGAWICAFVLVVPFLASFEPRLEHDALSYHLELPLSYWRDHGFRAWPWNLYANMPHAFDLLGTLGYGFGGVTGANLMAFHGTLLAVAALFVAARRAGGVGFGGALGLLYLASPMTWKYWSGTWVEPAVGAWLCWSFVLLQRYVARPDRRAIVALASCAAWTAGTKHVSVLWLAGLALLALVAVVRHVPDARERRAQLASVALALVCVFAPWAVKAWAATGDPLHPLLHAWRPGAGWSAVQAFQQTAFFERPVPFPPEVDAHRHAWAVPDLVLHPYRRFTQPIALAVGLLWCAGPLVAWAVAAWRRRRADSVERGAPWPANAVGASVWTAIGLALFAATSLSSFGRYAAGFLAPVVLAAGLPFAPLVRSITARVLALGGAALVFAWHLDLPKMRWETLREDGWRAVLAESPTVRVMSRANEVLPPDARVFVVYENRTWPLAAVHDDDSVLQAPSSLRRLSSASDARAAADRLRELGFTHVLIDAFNESKVFTNERGYVLTDPVLYPPAEMEREKALVRALLASEAERVFTEGSHELYRLTRP